MAMMTATPIVLIETTMYKIASGRIPAPDGEKVVLSTPDDGEMVSSIPDDGETLLSIPDDGETVSSI